MTDIEDPDVHLLPSNASALERLTSASAARRFDGIPTPIETIKRPFDAPTGFLPPLAWEVSLDVWEEDWPEWRKRRAIANSIHLHRIKGTLPAFIGWLDVIGAELQSYVIPPIGAYASPGTTKAERAAFAAQFPELRIYLESNYGAADADLYTNDGFSDSEFFTVSTAGERYGQRAYLIDQGVTTPLPMLPVTWAGAAAINEGLVGVVIPGEDDGGFFIADAAVDAACVTAAKITSQLLSIAADRSYVPLTPQPVVLPSDTPPLTLMNVTPERVATTGSIGPDVLHTDAGFIEDYLGAKDSSLRIYDRYYLYDATRVVGLPGSDGGFFLDSTRLEIPPFYAEMRVHLGGASPVPTFMLDDGFVGEACMMPVQGQLDRVAAALRAAKSHRDQIWFTTQISRPVEFADAPPLDGTIAFDAEIPLYD
jgi:hypothetical protein